MKPFFLLLTLAAICLPVMTPAQSGLAQYRNRHRVLLVFAPSRADPRWQKQNALLAGSAAEFKERDLLRFDYLEHGENRGAALRMQYGVKPGQFRVLLIGKDGHVAFSSPVPVGVHDLNEQIDRMPMRREEMRRAEERKRS